MSRLKRNGLMVGTLAGFVIAFSHWDGRVIVATSSILMATAIGWGIGAYLENRRAR